ncbi:MAG: DUF4328 domain-containing protein [Acidimicrobiales bacterium]
MEPSDPLPPPPGPVDRSDFTTRPSDYQYAFPRVVWQNPTGLARAVRIVLIVEAALLFLNVLASLYFRTVASDYANGGRSDDEFLAAFGLWGMVSVLTLVGQIGTGVVVIIWQWRLAKNHELMGRPGTTFGPGWAIAGWLIPVVSLVIPYLQLRELWKGSDWRFRPHQPDWKDAPVGPALNLWWLGWIVGSVGGVVVQFAGQPDTDDLEAAADSLESILSLSVPVLLISVATAVLFLIVVQQLTERHTHAVSLAAAGRLGEAEG